MAAVPSQISAVLEVQDVNGYTAITKVPMWLADISADAGDAGGNYALIQALATAVAAATNGKIVRQAMTYEFNLAQRPTGSPALYPNVNQRASMHFSTGFGERMAMSIPAPKASIFVTTPPDEGLVVDPANSLVLAVIAAVTSMSARGSNTLFNEFNGGQLIGGKPRKRRVLLGS